MNCNLKEYKEFIDNEMLLILGQMDKATLIFDHVYLVGHLAFFSCETAFKGFTRSLSLERSVFPVVIVFGGKVRLKGKGANILGLIRITLHVFTGIRMECLKFRGAARNRVTCFILCKN